MTVSLGTNQQDFHVTFYKQTNAMLQTWLYSDDHTTTQLNGALYIVCVVNVHSKIMAHVMRTEFTSNLQWRHHRLQWRHNMNDKLPLISQTVSI